MAQLVRNGGDKHDRPCGAVSIGNFIHPVDQHKREPPSLFAAARRVTHRILCTTRRVVRCARSQDDRDRAVV